jgi:hypothetical protein
LPPSLCPVSYSKILAGVAVGAVKLMASSIARILPLFFISFFHCLKLLELYQEEGITDRGYFIHVIPIISVSAYEHYSKMMSHLQKKKKE